ncbi:unnamed protein product [Caenorhabditis angaria]|uniref:Uncharacterized protein n=1 Tax=Caenorhabditis angaria TaxID=860376 RepID=A0A9P1I9H2_9PELO|nr:unnamed protein product [Caenorhabditis angaria]
MDAVVENQVLSKISEKQDVLLELQKNRRIKLVRQLKEQDVKTRLQFVESYDYNIIRGLEGDALFRKMEQFDVISLPNCCPLNMHRINNQNQWICDHNNINVLEGTIFEGLHFPIAEILEILLRYCDGEKQYVIDRDYNKTNVKLVCQMFRRAKILKYVKSNEGKLNAFFQNTLHKKIIEKYG